MRSLFLLCSLFPVLSIAQSFSPDEIARWQQQARRVTIVRDHWGIPHISGKSDADAVFGLLYAQCEDDFPRVEMNYIEKLGRMAEIKGESELYEDLLIRLVIDTAGAKADYLNAPNWLRQLLIAQADGINYYLYRHPEVRPALIARFEPWFPLLWTDGSIGAINTAELTTDDLRRVYGSPDDRQGYSTEPAPFEAALTGSNGFAFSPSITASGNAMLYINPHVTFYFRPEVHVRSREGLNTYGAVTWGQFFVYQGFNEYCGWMHTSSYTDIADTYREKTMEKNGRLMYQYDGEWQPVQYKNIALRYKTDTGMAEKQVKAMFTRHGPVMAQKDGQWISMKANNRSLTSLIQSWQRTKARSFADFKATMNLLANTSNNTVYADREGNIAYWHGNFMPVRDTSFDWSGPVDGSISRTEWKGLHPVAETVHCINPPNGWLQNCNATPFTVAGPYSPKRGDYPAYMAPDGENFRGINAVRVLTTPRRYTLDSVIAAGYNRYLAAFEVLIPALQNAYARQTRGESLQRPLAAPMQVLSAWDYHSSDTSVAVTLAIEWAQRILPDIQKEGLEEGLSLDIVQKTQRYAVHTAPNELLQPLLLTVRELEQRWGTWRVPWGNINRFQRISGDIQSVFDDGKPSIPVGFAASVWGQLPSYTGKYYPGTQKRYGVNGNSFVCAVEFGKKVKARSLLAGGQNNRPSSPHFNDQMERYAKGQFKEVLFYQKDIRRHIERKYHPGEER